MANKEADVIARYGNWYKGSDDLFTHCLILRSGECHLLGQGLQVVTLSKFKARAEKFKKLKAAISPIPDAWPNASYGGYNFITDAESPTASEIAIYGKKKSGLAGYFVPPSGSLAETLVKAIAKID
jgi:hypothetical protein